MDMPADWAVKKADALMKGEVPVSYHKALARYIEAHEQPPADPDLVTAREICALVAEGLNRTGSADLYREGLYDNVKDVQFALAMVKRDPAALEAFRGLGRG